MVLQDELLKLSAWFENPENEILKEAGENNIDKIANLFIKISSELQEAAVQNSIDEQSLKIDEPFLDKLTNLANMLDNSNDKKLISHASVLDELLLTFAAPKSSVYDFQKAQDDKIELLKQKYHETKKELDEMNKVSDALKDIKKSPMYKEYRPLEAPLSTRTCPDHPGSQFARLGEDMWQCAMDGKVYDFKSGFKTMQGDTIPGGNVSNQTEIKPAGHVIFDTRNDRLGNA